MAEISEEWDVRLKRFGWAPGGYMNKCLTCGETHIDGDKRATSCRPCAEQCLAILEAGFREGEEDMRERAAGLADNDLWATRELSQAIRSLPVTGEK